MYKRQILYFYRKERVLNYDFMSRKGFVTYKNNKEFFRLYKEFLHLKKLCRKKYDVVRTEYRERGREVMNLEFWSRYLEIDSKEKDLSLIHIYMEHLLTTLYLVNMESQSMMAVYIRK